MRPETDEDFATSVRTFTVEGVEVWSGGPERYWVVQIVDGRGLVLNGDDNPHTMKAWALDYANGLNPALGPPPEGATVVVFDTMEGVGDGD